MALACKNDTSKDSLFEGKNYIKVSSDKDSVLNMQVTYMHKNDENQHMLKSYWDNGKLQAVSYFNKGVKVGDWKQFFDDGKLSFEGGFLNGLKHGTHKIYHSNGKLLAVEEYDKGEEVKIWYYYNEDGTLNRKETQEKLK
jgi:antitoxin component YwqK of YwqJK toxin-antitoxin module